MQINNFAVNRYKAALKVLTFFIFISSIVLSFLSVRAMGGDPSPAQIAQLVQASDCPDAIKETFADINAKNGDVSNYTGTFYIAKAPDGTPISISCGTAIKIQKILIRVVVILLSFVGLVLAFSIGKSAVMMITAFDDQEKFQAAIKSLVTAIAATVGVFVSYIVLVFIFVGILGVGTTNSQHKEWNVFCQHRIVLTITFTQGDDPCQAGTQKDGQ